VTEAVVAARFLHLAATIIVTGVFGFLLFVFRPALRKAAVESQAPLARLDQRLLRLGSVSLLVALVSALAWLALQASVASGRPLTQALDAHTLAQMLTETHFGRLWQLRVGLMLLLGGFLLLREPERDGRDWWSLRLQGFGLGGALVVALAWSGHAAATEGWERVVSLAADSIHILAAGVWLGGLVPLALLLALTRRSPAPDAGIIAAHAARHFSLLGLVTVSGLVLTGTANSWILVGDFPRLIGTGYGRLLLLKLALLLPLIAVAAVNRRRLIPGLLAHAEAPGTSHAFLRRLIRNVGVETGLGAAILLVVAWLGVTAPARHLDPEWPFAFRLSWEAMKDVPGVRVRLVGGGVFALAGLAALGWACARRFRPRWALGLGPAGAAYGAWVGLAGLAIDAYPTTYLRPAVPYQALSVARGASLYTQHCAVCHGAGGYGDGPAARGLAREPADLTAKHTADHTAGDLFWWLTHGIRGTPMPGFKDRLGEEERWDLINFLRAFAAAEQARPMGAVVAPEPWLVAPDFTFGTGVGPGETLKSHRGWAMVHLVMFTLPDSLPRLDELERAWWDIGVAGARMITVPMRDAGQVYQTLGARATNFPIAVDGSDEIVQSYMLFRRTGAPGRVPSTPSHMEFLIDRQGYVRARWIPGEGRGWSEISRLLAEVERLGKEAPRAPAPEEHVH